MLMSADCTRMYCGSTVCVSTCFGLVLVDLLFDLSPVITPCRGALSLQDERVSKCNDRTPSSKSYATTQISVYRPINGNGYIPLLAMIYLGERVWRRPPEDGKEIVELPGVATALHPEGTLAAGHRGYDLLPLAGRAAASAPFRLSPHHEQCRLLLFIMSSLPGGSM